MMELNENDIAKIVLECAIKVHRTTGPGLLESAYQECLDFELTKAGLKVQKQKALPLIYEEIHLEVGYRIDLLVNNKVVIEIKSVDAIAPVHKAQVITYLKLSGCKLGLLINFNVALLKDGFKRIVNGL
jgi:GxxExxY protein